MNLRKDHLHEYVGCELYLSVASASLAQGLLANIRAACFAHWRCVCMCCCCVGLWVLMPSAYLLQTCAATNALAQKMMKDAVRCDMHGDLQNSVKQLVSECAHCFQTLLQASPYHCLLVCISRCCKTINAWWCWCSDCVHNHSSTTAGSTLLLGQPNDCTASLQP